MWNCYYSASPLRGCFRFGNVGLYDIDLDEYKELTLRNGHTCCEYELSNFSFSGVTGKGVLTFSQALYDEVYCMKQSDVPQWALKVKCYACSEEMGHRFVSDCPGIFRNRP